MEPAHGLNIGTDPMTATLLAALGGAIIAVLLGLFGGGGSVLATPWLLYAVGIADPHVAIGTVGSTAFAGRLEPGAGRHGEMALRLELRRRWPCWLAGGRGAGPAG